MTRAARLEYINLMRERFAPALGIIRLTDAESLLVKMMLTEWEKQAQALQETDPVKRAYNSFVKLQGMRHWSRATTFDHALAALKEEGVI